MDPSLLQELGLTKGEATVYLALLDLGESRVGRVIEKSGMASSAVHNALHALAEKGLASHILRGKVRHFHAAPPRDLLTILDEKRQRLQEALPKLEVRHRLAETRTEAEVYVGFKGIMALLHELIADATKKDIYRFFATERAGKNEDIQRFFRRYDALRVERCRAVRGLVPKRLQTVFSGRPQLKIRYVNALPSNTMICGEKLAHVTWGEKPSGVLIHSKDLAKKHAVFFDEMWKRAKS